MSKAFTDEEALTTPVPGRRVERALPGQERPITAQGHAALLARVSAARSQVVATSGDARTHADYQLALVEAALASVRVVEPGPVDGEVRFGSSVELQWEDGRVQRVVLVGADEVDLMPSEGVTRLSVQSPLGRALVGQRTGDEVEFVRPRGATVATITRVTAS